jgi:hypothetical protein
MYVKRRRFASYAGRDAGRTVSPDLSSSFIKMKAELSSKRRPTQIKRRRVTSQKNKASYETYGPQDAKSVPKMPKVLQDAKLPLHASHVAPPDLNLVVKPVYM